MSANHILPHKGRGAMRGMVAGQAGLLRKVNVMNQAGCPSTTSWSPSPCRGGL
jgi:hypothetical protein